jgi:hypothetical protein
MDPPQTVAEARQEPLAPNLPLPSEQEPSEPLRLLHLPEDRLHERLPPPNTGSDPTDAGPSVVAQRRRSSPSEDGPDSTRRALPYYPDPAGNTPRRPALRYLVDRL